MDYDDIVAAGISYADRFTDSEVIGNIDTFLRFGEARLSRLLKVRKASVRAILSVNPDADYYSIPSDFGGLRDIQLNCIQPDGSEKRKTLRYMNPEQIEWKSQQTSNNDLGYYCIVADQIRVSPTVGSSDFLEIAYYQRILPLSPGNPNNWVSDDHPDLYLASLMYEIELFVKNHDVATGWEERLNKALDELGVTDVEERWSGTPLEIRTDFNTGNRRP
jgi:hypothetical protein